MWKPLPIKWETAIANGWRTELGHHFIRRFREDSPQAMSCKGAVAGECPLIRFQLKHDVLAERYKLAYAALGALAEALSLDGFVSDSCHQTE